MRGRCAGRPRGDVEKAVYSACDCCQNSNIAKCNQSTLWPQTVADSQTRAVGDSFADSFSPSVDTITCSIIIPPCFFFRLTPLLSAARRCKSVLQCSVFRFSFLRRCVNGTCMARRLPLAAFSGVL